MKYMAASALRKREEPPNPRQPPASGGWGVKARGRVPAAAERER